MTANNYITLSEWNQFWTNIHVNLLTFGKINVLRITTTRQEALFGLQTEMLWRVHWFKYDDNDTYDIYNANGDDDGNGGDDDNMIADTGWGATNKVPWGSSRLGKNSRKAPWGCHHLHHYNYSHSHDEQVGKGNTGMKKLVADWAKRAAFKHHEEQMAGKLIASSTDFLFSRHARQQHQLPHCQEARPFQVIRSPKHLYPLLNSIHLFHTWGNLHFQHLESRIKFSL